MYSSFFLQIGYIFLMFVVRRLNRSWLLDFFLLSSRVSTILKRNVMRGKKRDATGGNAATDGKYFPSNSSHTI